MNNLPNVLLCQAGAIVHQSVSQMRTVAAYNGEERAKNEYAARLDLPAQVRAAVGRVQGLAFAGCSAEHLQLEKILQADDAVHMQHQHILLFIDLQPIKSPTLTFDAAFMYRQQFSIAPHHVASADAAAAHAHPLRIPTGRQEAGSDLRLVPRRPAVCDVLLLLCRAVLWCLPRGCRRVQRRRGAERHHCVTHRQLLSGPGEWRVLAPPLLGIER